MKYKLDRGAHSVYSLHYHLIFVVKYRRKVFTDDEIIDFLKQKIHEISETFEVEIYIALYGKYYVHILFKAKPTLNIPKYKANAEHSEVHQCPENHNIERDQEKIPRSQEKAVEKCLLVFLILLSDNWTGYIRCSEEIRGITG